MKVSTAEWLNGMPATDTYYIHLDNGVRLSLSKEQYQALCVSIDEKNANDIEKITQLTDRYDKRVNAVHELVKDIRDVFYEDMDDFSIRHSVDNIDVARLDGVLEKHSRTLGFE